MASLLLSLSLTLGQLVHPRDDDDEECEQLGVREDVLHLGCPADVPAVNERQHHCRHSTNITLVIE